MERLCFAAMGAVVVVGLAVALGLLIRTIGGLDNLLTKALAFVGLAGVPISIALWAIKVPNRARFAPLRRSIYRLSARERTCRGDCVGRR